MLGKATAYSGRLMRAYIRYYLQYTPDIINAMTTRQIAEAFEDILFVRKREKEASGGLM